MEYATANNVVEFHRWILPRSLLQVVLLQVHCNALGAADFQHGRGKIHAVNFQPGFGKQPGGESAADAQVKQALAGLDKFIAKPEEDFGNMTVTGLHLIVIIGGVRVMQTGRHLFDLCERCQQQDQHAAASHQFGIESEAGNGLLGSIV